MNRRSASPMISNGNNQSTSNAGPYHGNDGYNQPVAPRRRKRGKSLSMTRLSYMGSSIDSYSNDPYNQMYANSPPMIQNTFGYDRGKF